EMAVELALVDVDRCLLEAARLRHAIDREAAQALALMVPGVEVPVVAVVGDALRRDRAPRLLVGRACAVFEGQALALEYRGADRAEGMLVEAAGAVGNHPHPLHRPLLAAGMLGQQLLDA